MKTEEPEQITDEENDEKLEVKRKSKKVSEISKDENHVSKTIKEIKEESKSSNKPSIFFFFF